MRIKKITDFKVGDKEFFKAVTYNNECKVPKTMIVLNAVIQSEQEKGLSLSKKGEF